MLGKVLIQAFESTEEVDAKDKRGILFAKTRASTEALKKWIEETMELQFLKPGKLIGSGRVGGKLYHSNENTLILIQL